MAAAVDLGIALLANANTSRTTEEEREKEKEEAGKIVFAEARRYWQVLRPSPTSLPCSGYLVTAQRNVIYGRERVKNRSFNAFAAESRTPFERSWLSEREAGELPLSATRFFSVRLIGCRKIRSATEWREERKVERYERERSSPSRCDRRSTCCLIFQHSI